jgi:putative flippase GtrA
MSGQFLRFLSTGGFAALVNLVSRHELSRILRFEVAVVLAYLLGMIVAYVLARRFVFQGSGRSVASEFKRFAIVNVFSFTLVWSISVGLAQYLFPAIGFVWRADDVAHFIGVLTPAVTSYFGHRAYTFSTPKGVGSVDAACDPKTDAV